MTLATLLVLSIAVYRATRLVAEDSITLPLRKFLRRWQLPYELATCPWCLSIWIGALAIAMFHVEHSATLDVADVLVLSAVAGLITERA